MIPENLIVRVRQFDLDSVVNLNGQVTKFSSVESRVFVREFKAKNTVQVQFPVINLKVAERGPKGDFASIPTFIQPDPPNLKFPYYWIQTNVDGDPTRFSEWFYDGVE